MHTLTLPYSRPPLTPNQRLHWAQKARITRQIRPRWYRYRCTKCGVRHAFHRSEPIAAQERITCPKVR